MTGSNVVPITAKRGSVVEDLRKLADQIERGDFTPAWAIVCWQDNESHLIGRTFCGDTPRTSSLLGILSYVSHMLYEQKDGA